MPKYEVNSDSQAAGSENSDYRPSQTPEAAPSEAQEKPAAVASAPRSNLRGRWKKKTKPAAKNTSTPTNSKIGEVQPARLEPVTATADNTAQESASQASTVASVNAEEHRSQVRGSDEDPRKPRARRPARASKPKAPEATQNTEPEAAKQERPAKKSAPRKRPDGKRSGPRKSENKSARKRPATKKPAAKKAPAKKKSILGKIVNKLFGKKEEPKPTRSNNRSGKPKARNSRGGRPGNRGPRKSKPKA